jgi:hypothetical protein
LIETGQRKKARYWGEFTVTKVAKLEAPILCHSKEIGEVEFMPTLVKINWESSPSLDRNEFWFPYWVKIKASLSANHSLTPTQTYEYTPSYTLSHTRTGARAHTLSVCMKERGSIFRPAGYVTVV